MDPWETLTLIESCIPRIPLYHFSITAIALVFPLLIVALKVTPAQTHWLNIVLLAVHSVYLLYNILVEPPPNVFRSLGVPINAPVSVLRAGLGDTGADVALENLLDRFSSFDPRVYYVRFGHNTLLDCEHCTTFTTHALTALPNLILSYIPTLAFQGILTSPATRRERWRTWTIIPLLLLGPYEFYKVSIARVDMPRPGVEQIMWHDVLYLLRHIVFLVLPFVTLYFLPLAPETTPALVHTVTVLQDTLRRLEMFAGVQAASMRSPSLRQRIVDYWETQEEKSNQGRQNKRVQAEAARLQQSYASGPPAGPLRTKAIEVSKVLIERLKSVEEALSKNA
ncbi:hypothetical protein SISSUDRAFT_993196 [Sistotremastrum suecicum HHB10207 ss-3]|uniref:Uncharacterized protein n=1 Tax=Sistotremastrum suecicum HHB10207 ss-3 TaxID=1314776 RepID=A0A165YJL0_9AGAM|nr:hypothetical protein SISSUDRAFT_993196 [Sistotremastrum suecicum HHB10207 ss-3]